MTFKQVILTIIGLRRKDDNQEEIFRRMTLIIASSGMNGGKVAGRFNKMWPSRMKHKGPSTAERAKAIIQTYRERTAIKRAKEKINAGRSENSSSE